MANAAAAGSFSLPPLKYKLDALSPAISAETMDYHYNKHLQAYVNNLNALIENTQYVSMSLEDIIRNSSGPIFNNAAQLWNHTFFFNTLAPGAERLPEARLLDAIIRDFGSLELFKEQFTKAATSLFGSGWVFLVADKKGNLAIESHPNASNPLAKGHKALMCIDVWEHAYYIDYRNRRAEYIAALWKLYDWKTIEKIYDEAQ